MATNLTDESVINDIDLQEAQIRVMAWYDSANDELKEMSINYYGQLLTSDWHLEVALWLVDWATQYAKFGRNPDIDTWTTPEDCWNGWGLYTGFPTWSAETLEIFSDNINDTAAWTGARTVTIGNLLDEDYNLMPSITVTLNWTTAVSLWAQTYIRSSRMSIITVWSSWHNLWTLTLRHTITTANIFAQMPAETNQTTIMAFTVPAWKKILMNRWFISMWRTSWAAWSAEVSIRRRQYSVAWDNAFNAIRYIWITNSSNYSFQNNWYFVFNEKDDIKVTIEDVSDNSTFVNAEADWYIIDVA